MSTSVSLPVDQPIPPRSLGLLIRLLLGGVSGLGAGLIYGLLLSSQRISPMMSPTDLPGDTLFHLLLSAAIGGLFVLLLDSQITSSGSGLVWGIAFGVAWWFIGPMTLFPMLHGAPVNWSIATGKAAFSLLMGLAVVFGALLGLVYWVLSRVVASGLSLQAARSFVLHTLQSTITGGLAGSLGGWVFGQWMEEAGFFPLVASIVNASDAQTGRDLHMAISVIIGISYSLLFQRDIRTLGASIAWGVVYGLVWWVLGSLTFMPALLGQGVQWSIETAQDAFASLIGHLVYGLTLGITHAALSQVWRTLFVDSDPLMREPEGPGTRNLRALGLGAAASVVGGLAFTSFLIASDALPTVAQLAGMNGVVSGFIIHMVISTVIGGMYGLLYRRETTSNLAALAWGVFYGFVWWVLGSLTLMPVLLGLPLQWSGAAAEASFPSLIGHLVYGVLLSLVYASLQRRYAARLFQRAPMQPSAFHSTAVPALWLLVTVLLPVILLLLLPAP